MTITKQAPLIAAVVAVGAGVLIGAPQSHADTVVAGEGVFMPRGNTAKQFGGAFCKTQTCVSPTNMPTSTTTAANQIDAAVRAAMGNGEDVTVIGYSLTADALSKLVAKWNANPATAPDPARVRIITTGSPVSRYGGTQRDYSTAVPIPNEQAYDHLDVVMQYDSVADKPVRRGWYSMMEVSLNRHMAYPEADINDPNNLVREDGNTVYMLIPAKELKQLSFHRTLVKWGAMTQERYNEIDAERRAKIEADYDRPQLVEQGAGADWVNNVKPEALRDEEPNARVRSTDDDSQDDAAVAGQVVHDTARGSRSARVSSESDSASRDADLQRGADAHESEHDSDAEGSDDAGDREAVVRRTVDRDSASDESSAERGSVASGDDA